MGSLTGLHSAAHEPQVAGEALSLRKESDIAQRLLTIAFPLLLVVLFSHLSNTLIRNFGIPSLLQALIAGAALLVWMRRHLLRPDIAALHPVALLLTAYAAVVFTSSIWATETASADARLAEVLKSVIICILVGSVAAASRTLRTAASAIALTAATLGAISLLQVTTGWLDPALGGLLDLETGTIYGSHAAPRAAGPPVSDPNFYARILLIALPLSAALAINARSIAGRLFYGVGGAIIGGAVLATYSRGAMLALAVITALFLLSLRVSIARVSVLLAAALVLVVLLPDDVRKRFLTVESIVADATGSERDSSVEKRKLLLRSGLEMFLDHPVRGVGGGGFGLHYPAYANRVGSQFTDYHDPGSIEFPHALYLEVASETGLLGLVTLGGALAAACVSIWRSRRALLDQGRNEEAVIATTVGVALAGYLVTSLFLHETHLRYVGLQFGLVIAVHRIATAQQRGAVVEDPA
jgi:putative inorganic carbon (hco3(-)) transporter